MTLESLSEVKSAVEGIEASPAGIEKLLSSLGYSILPRKEQSLDPDTLFQQKDLRERVTVARKLFSMQGTWKHPTTGQAFKREAAVLLVEVRDEQTLKSRWPFEITRYAVKFGFPTSQVIFFFTAPNARSFVVSAYEMDTSDRIQVRRLIVDLGNLARTDIEAIAGLVFPRMRAETIVDEFRAALPHLKVGREFFQQYHDLFSKLSKRVTPVLGSSQQAYGYVQRLLGRITFLYFLQRKGWLDSDSAYLRKRAKNADGARLFEFLYELFDTLNTEDHPLGTKGRIPYLNGSLFEDEGYPRTQMKKIGEACAPFIVDALRTFDQYNFTISESTPLNKEVAVDPELLGSLFESMLPDAERGDKGTFYTHQEEMLFMAAEGLRVYLERFTQILSQDQVFYIVYGAGPSSASRLEPKVARGAKDLLRQIKVLDPAVGSGGFLMATLQVLLEARGRLNGIIGAVEKDYDVKLEVIENNLFGVDIEEEAIELARLRLWLSLVVDEPLENVRPLPNLDQNLHVGDSLKLPEFEKQRQMKITVDPTIRGALLKEISTVREEYSRSHGKEKESKRAELDNTLGKLLEMETGKRPPKVLPFSYRYFFADIVADGGFDLILMNPPYIRNEDIGKLAGQSPDTYKSEIGQDAYDLTGGRLKVNKRADISVYFHVRSLSLLKTNGVAVVIATSKWLDVRYGVALQEYLLQNSAIDYVLDSEDRSFAADVNTVITVIRKKKTAVANNLVSFVYFKIPFGKVNGQTIWTILDGKQQGVLFTDLYRVSNRTQGDLYNDGLASRDDEEEEKEAQKLAEPEEPSRKSVVYQGTKWGNLHLRAPAVYFSIMAKAKERMRPLRSVALLKRGEKTANHDYFILREIPENRKDKNVFLENGLGYKTYLEERYAPRVLQDPEDIASYFITKRDIRFRIFRCKEDKSQLKGTFALRYIEWAEKSPEAKVRVLKGKHGGDMVRVPELSTALSRKRWYEISDTAPSKILAPNLVKNRHVIPMSEIPLYAYHNFFCLYAEDEIDLWLYMNSSIFRLFMELYGRSEGAGALQVMGYEYEQCPVPNSIGSLAQEFTRLAVFRTRVPYRIINISEEAPLEFEQEDRHELDQIILRMMGFTNKEERDVALNEVYSWLRCRVGERLLKPKTAPESAMKGLARKSQADLREFA